jgi:hypothetical protein
MRKLLLPAVCLFAFVFTAFVVQPGKGVSKIGNSLYKVNPGAAMAKADKDELANTVAKLYNIKNLEQAGEVKLQGMDYESAKGFRRTIAVETTISKDRVSERVFIIRGDAMGMDDTMNSVGSVLSKYGK